MPLIYKQKRSTKIGMSNTTSNKQHSTHIAHLEKQRKLSPSSSRSTLNYTSTLKPLSTPPYSSYTTSSCSSDESSDDYTFSNNDDDSKTRARHLKGKGPTSTVCHYHSHQNEWKCGPNTLNNDDDDNNKYEVEKILDSRVYSR